VLKLLQQEGKVPQGWSELLLVTDGTYGYNRTVLNAWKGGDPSKGTGVAAITGKGHHHHLHRPSPPPNPDTPPISTTHHCNLRLQAKATAV
jgi:hypothetical protein